MNDLTARKIVAALENVGVTMVEKEQLDALEDLYAAAKAYTANWGRSRGGMMYRADEPEGTALPLLEALERLEGFNHVDQ